MFKPLSCFIGLRYTRAKRKNHFISFISLSSMVGIALGVLVLITVLSVMNGFDREIKKRVFGMVPAITIGSIAGTLSNWQSVNNSLKNIPDIVASAPFVNGYALLSNAGYTQPALINGINPTQEKKISVLSEKMVSGQLDSLKPNSFTILLGQELAERLGANLGDKVTVMVPQFSLTPAGVMPRFKRFTVSGIFHAGGGFGFDMTYAFINLSDAQKLFGLGQSVTGLHLSIQDEYQAPVLSDKLTEFLGPNAHITNWSDQYGAFFQAVSLEKTMMFFILMLIIAVAVFNLVSTLVMVVNDKEADIAILRTFGATPRMIMGIFIVQGAIIGIVGTVLGLVGGVLLALNVTQLVNGIEQLFNVHFISSNVYFVDYLPSELQWMDVIKICAASLVFSLLATLYPAWRASKTLPVEALRYE